MLLIVSTNPTVDRTIDVPVLTPHRVHRSTKLQLSAGGKGLNVGRAAKTLGIPYLVAGFLGGASGQLLDRLTQAEGLKAAWIEFEGVETKMSHLLRHTQGDSTVINEPGPALTADQCARADSFILDKAQAARSVILAGSVPPGVKAADYLQLCKNLQRRAHHVLVDTPGETLKAAITYPQGLALKVNSEELSEAMHRPLEGLDDLKGAAQELLDRGADLVCITRGREGALAVEKNGAWLCSYELANPVSSVGSGDSFSAGLSLKWMRSLPLPEALRWASACGAANAQTELPARFSLESVKKLLPLIKVEKL
ncbi:MAG: 1-phosphofructokinase family hexose kinase [bacterium]|nr:1-phosphofructokinase family hexose kinase [bacterium]